MGTIFVKLFIIPAIFYGLASWIMWQGMKVGTELPVYKSLIGRGGNISRVMKLLYFLVIIKFSYENGFYYVFSFLPVWYVSGWISTFLERKLYMEKAMEIALRIIEDSGSDVDAARRKLSEAIPSWWVVLMPKKWSETIETSLRSML